MAPTLFSNPPKPGDLIEIDRGLYNHWAIYIGNNEVVHLIPPSEDTDLLGGVLSLMDSNWAQVRRQKIWEVAPSSYHVNNLLDDTYEARPRGYIVSDACKLVGRTLPYALTTHNCEHFVTELRYGKAESRQVRDTQGALAVGAVATVALGAILFGALLSSSAKNEERCNRRHH